MVLALESAEVDRERWTRTGQLKHSHQEISRRLEERVERQDWVWLSWHGQHACGPSQQHK